MKTNVEDHNNDRRKLLGLSASLGTIATLSPLLGLISPAYAVTTDKIKTPKAFVYTELQLSLPFDKVPWKKAGKAIVKQPGFINKTWLSGLDNNSVGGIYAFDSIENAQKYVTEFFPELASKFGVAQTTRVFDATVTEDASRGVNSAHYDAKVDKKVGAFVYTEVQINVPFEKAPWRERNPILMQQQGLLYKTWLSGLHTNTLGGIDAFDTIENAKAFALNDFPKVAKKLNSAFYTRIFDASVTEAASRQLHSPFYT
jgi:hypothetical protein